MWIHLLLNCFQDIQGKEGKKTSDVHCQARVPVHRVDAECFQISGNCDFLVAVESHTGNHQSHSNVILQDPEYLLEYQCYSC